MRLRRREEEGEEVISWDAGSLLRNVGLEARQGWGWGNGVRGGDEVVRWGGTESAE